MKDAIAKTYLAKGEQVISMNQAAVDRGISDLVEVEVPAEWKDLPSDPVVEDTRNIPDFIKNVVEPSNLQIGDSIPVSEFVPYADGSYPLGTTQYEKRGVASKVPEWDVDKCVQCNRCAWSARTPLSVRTS